MSNEVYEITSRRVENEPQLPERFEKQLAEYISRYPHRASAVMPALYLAQEYFGYISQEAILWVAARLEWSPVKVMEIATFYTMYYKHPVGTYHVQVCRTLPCALRGASKLTEYLKERWGLEPEQVSPDGKWSYEEVECLGSCGSAPMCQINDRFFENLTFEDLKVILDSLEKDGGDLRLSACNQTLGKGLFEYSPSQIEAGKACNK
jgi:NADH-quinone oxidoreductase E subunit